MLALSIKGRLQNLCLALQAFLIFLETVITSSKSHAPILSSQLSQDVRSHGMINEFHETEPTGTFAIFLCWDRSLCVVDIGSSTDQGFENHKAGEWEGTGVLACH